MENPRPAKGLPAVSGVVRSFFGLGDEVEEGGDFLGRFFENPFLLFRAEMKVHVFGDGKCFEPAILDFTAGGGPGCLTAIEKRNVVSEHPAVDFFFVVSVHERSNFSVEQNRPERNPPRAGSSFLLVIFDHRVFVLQGRTLVRPLSAKNYAIFMNVK
jgi:hypothetical protein